MLYLGKHVEVAPFDIDVTEVSVAAYRACVDARACTLPYFQDQGALVILGRPFHTDYANAHACHWADGKIDHPINCVDHGQAAAYCAWAGRRLPTAIEFIYAGVGDSGWKYPWGNDEPVRQDPCVCGSYDATCPVWSNPRGQSKFGVFHLADNVGEWLADPWCPRDDAPCSGDSHAVIGGSLASALKFDGRSVGAALDVQRGPQNGFRCAKTP
jgi:formylglycine-generating enzyme required for sulfatase activity